MSFNRRGVRVVARDNSVKKSLFTSIFKGHKLSPSDINYVVDIIEGINMTNEQMAKFANQTYLLSNTGRYSLSYNHDLNQAIKVRDSNRIMKLIDNAGTQQAWPELYDNPKLEPKDITLIGNISNKEYYIMLNTIETATTSKDFQNIMPCGKDSVDSISINDKRLYFNSIYEKCQNKICVYEAEQVGKIISLSNDVPKVAYVADKEGDKYQGYCFDILFLIERLAKGNYENPATDELFSDVTRDQLLSKYHKEIQMFKRYLLIIANR